ncbi:MAG: peptide chain release factor N(5)-glutamine methyltransferase [Pirellulales bacterium]
MPSDPWTIGRLLQWTTQYLGDHGSESPRLEAEVLLAHARGCKRIELYTTFEEPASDELRQSFRGLVKRRAEGMPVAYLVGKREFFSLEFEVTPGVLIPRPETEHVVVALFDAVKQSGRSGDGVRIADIGTGSGILAVTAAKRLTSAKITAVDISPAALEVARRNAVRHGVADRIEFIQSDLFDGVPPDAVFDFLVSNPPYIATSEWEQLPPDVKNYEPRTALEAGPDGLAIIRRLIPSAACRLSDPGELFIEISPMIASPVELLIRSTPELELQPTTPDLASHLRVIHARRRKP